MHDYSSIDPSNYSPDQERGRLANKLVIDCFCSLLGNIAQVVERANRKCKVCCKIQVFLSRNWRLP